MTLDDLHDLMCGLSVGQTCSLHLDVYQLLFPPGEPDSGARAKAHKFAKAHGCEINNPTAGGQPLEVVFIRRVTNPPGCP